MTDYSITWGYIVSVMREKFGIAPDSDEKFAYGDLSRKLNQIWSDYFDELYEREQETLCDNR